MSRHFIIFRWATCGEKCLRVCPKCADSDHHTHAQSIIRAFAFDSYIMQHPITLLADSECPGQTARSADAQADLGLHCPHMPEDTFSLGAAQIKQSSNCAFTRAYHINSKFFRRQFALLNLTGLNTLCQLSAI